MKVLRLGCLLGKKIREQFMADCGKNKIIKSNNFRAEKTV